MIGFLLRRAFEAVLTVWIIVTVTFLLVRLLPGGPFDDEVATSSEYKQKIESLYGLDLSPLKQYQKFLSSITSGSWGESYRYPGMSMGEILNRPLGLTLTVGMMAAVLVFGLGLILGIVAAFSHRKFLDVALTVFFSVFMSMPSFVIGPLMVLVFSFWFDILPPALLESPAHYILPVIVLALRPLALVGRLTRAGLLEISGQDFMRTARARGLSRFQVLIRHGLRNGLIPLLSLAGPMAATLLSGSFIVEMIFAVPGLGRFFVDAISNRDFPMVVYMTFIYSCLLLFFQYIFEVLMALADPRIRIT